MERALGERESFGGRMRFWWGLERERESFGGRMRFWWGFSKQTSIHGKSFRGERESFDGRMRFWWGFSKQASINASETEVLVGVLERERERVAGF